MSMSELLRPFGYGVTKYRVMNVTKAKDKGSVAFYIDARDVMDRLDEVVGCENWQDKYTVLVFSDSRWAVECTLIVNGVAKTDVGEGDAPKDAYSDALKRAAVKFGIGRYLYDMDTGNWFAIDEWKNFTPDSKKQIDELLRRNLTRLGVNTQPQALRKDEPSTQVQPAPKPITNGNGSAKVPAQSNALKAFQARGTEVFGADWDTARGWLIERYTAKETPDNVRHSSKDLTDMELNALRGNMDEYAKGIVKAWATRRAELASITVNGAQEMVPACPPSPSRGADTRRGHGAGTRRQRRRANGSGRRRMAMRVHVAEPSRR